MNEIDLYKEEEREDRKQILKEFRILTTAIRNFNSDNGIKLVGEYDSEIPYEKGNVVEHDGKIYLSLQELNQKSLDSDSWLRLMKTGPKGRDGQDGKDGEDGKIASFEIQDGWLVAKYPEDEKWTKLLELQILKGEKGDKGDQGPRGKAGEPGIPGAIGKSAEEPKIELRVSKMQLQFRINGGKWKNIFNMTQMQSTSFVTSGGGGASGGGAWGSITGTLADQVDLQAELDAKADLTGADFTGDVTTTGLIKASGAYTENTTTAGFYAGGPTTLGTPRYMLADGNASRNWQFDNNGGTLRMFTPSVTHLSIDYSTSAITTNGTINGRNIATDGGVLDTAVQPTDPISTLSDVDTDKSKTPADGDVLTFDGTDWNAETPSAGGGQTLYDYVVAPSGGDYTTLTAYFADAPTAGDTVFVRSGTYTETGISSTLNDITIIGENAETTELSFGSNYFTHSSGQYWTIKNIKMTFAGGQHQIGAFGMVEGCRYESSNSSAVLINFSGKHINFSNNNLYQTSGNADRMLYVDNSQHVIANNVFDIATHSTTNGIIEFNNSDATSVIGNTFAINSVTIATAPVIRVASASQNCSVTGNTLLSGSTGTDGDGIGIYSLATFTSISGNAIGGFTEGIRVFADYNTVSGNNIKLYGGGSDDRGIYQAGRYSVINGNTIVNGTTSSAEYGIYLNDYDCAITGNTFRAIANGIYVAGAQYIGNTIVGNAFGNTTTPISGTSTGNIIKDNTGDNLTPLMEYNTQRMTNNTGGTVNDGEVVVFASVAGANELATTTTQGDDKVIGVVENNGNILTTATGYVQTRGFVNNLKVNGTTDIAIGDYLGTYTTAGIAMKASSGDMAFAIALEAYTTDDSSGVIDALLITPRKV